MKLAIQELLAMTMVIDWYSKRVFTKLLEQLLLLRKIFGVQKQTFFTFYLFTFA